MPLLRYFRSCTLISFCLLAPLAHAQSPEAHNEEVNRGNLPIQRIGPNDLLSIQVYGAPELTRSERVGADGLLRLPMLSQPVKVGGKFPADVERDLTDELKAEGLLVRPDVTVVVSEYRSRPISVIGAVNHPVTFQANSNATLLDAIARAEGLSPIAGSEIVVSRQGRNGEPGLSQRIPVKSLINHADESLNLRLHGGEEIRVPEGGRVFVMGDVKKPGAIQIHDTDELSVMRVISEAEGLEPYAGKEAYILRHGDSAAQIPVPLAKIMQRKAPDMPLEANDVLFVPDNKTGRAKTVLTEAVIALGLAALTGLVIFH